MARYDVQRSLSAAVLSLSISVLSCATAAEVSYGVDAGVGYSDNIGRTATAKQEETIGLVGASLSLTESSSRIEAKLGSDFEYREYFDDTFDSELVGQFVGTADIDLIRERLKWTIEDTFGQVISDQFSADTPNNRENVNYLSTGPTISIPLGRRLSAYIEGRYSDVYYEDSDLGNERLRGAIGVERELSSASRLSLLGSTESVEFDDTQTFSDYDRDEVYVRYDLQGARTSAELEIGATQVRRSEGEDSDWNELFRVRASRRVSAASSLTLEAGRQLSDAGESFRQLQTGVAPVNETQPVQQIGDVFTDTHVTLRWNLQSRRTGLSTAVSYFDEEYETQQQFDRRRWEYSAGIHRALGRDVTMSFGGVYTEQDYRRADRQFAEWSSFAGLDWQLGVRTYVSLVYEHSDRNDDVDSDEYRENEVWLRIGYSGGNIEGSRTPTLGSPTR